MKNLLFISIVFLLACTPPKNASDKHNTNTNSINYTVGFYNVENLFDTEDDPLINDDEFTDSGEKEWNDERYQLKLENISEVIYSLSTNGLPIAFGLCEVENKKVVEDLVNTESLKTQNYGIVHYDSQDERGIDNAFIYRKDVLKILSSKAITPSISINGIEDRTRDILYVKTQIKSQKSELHFFINHFPSRSGGQEKSEPKRLSVAKLLAETIAEIKFSDENAAIIILGDFNDMPNNKSIREILGACPLENNCYLNNLSYPFHDKHQGTYNYKGNWNVLDQIIVSKPLTNKENSMSILNNEAKILQSPFVMYTSEDGTTTPSRTYGGNNYYGGISDHLATYCTISIKQ